MKIETRLPPYYSAQGLTVKKSGIPHSDAKIGLFATRTIWKGEVLGDCYGSLVYAYTGTERHQSSMSGERVTQVTSETSWKRVNELLE